MAPVKKPPRCASHAMPPNAIPINAMTAAQMKMSGHGPLLASLPVSAPSLPCSYIIKIAAAKRPEMEPDAPITGVSAAGWRMKKESAPPIPQRKKNLIVVLVENMRSTKVPKAKPIRALKPICIQSAWMKL